MYSINLSNLSNNHQKKSILLADTAIQLANIMEEQNKLNDALKYAQKASEIYIEIYGN